MRLRIIREADRAPGAEERLQTTDTITWWVSADGITEKGARAFEACANYLYDRHWDDGAGHLRGRTHICYRLQPDLDCAVLMRFSGGTLVVRLHPEHFARATFNSGTVTLREQMGIEETVNAR